MLNSRPASLSHHLCTSPHHRCLLAAPLPICAVGSPRVCQSPSVLWLEDPLSPLPASESRTPPRPVDPVASPWLLAPSSPSWPISPSSPLGSLVPPAPPWSVIDHPPTQDSTPSLWLCQAPLSLRLHLGPLSLRLHCGLLDPRLRLSRRSHLRHLGPPNPPRRPGSLALRFRHGLHHHLLHHCQSDPWSRQPFLHHGSSLCQLHRGSPSWVRPGSCLALPAPSPSCLLPGSSLHLICLGSSCLRPGSSLHLLHHGHCSSSSSRCPSSSGTSPNHLFPSCFHSFVLLLSPPPSHPLLFLWCEVTSSGRGAICHTLWTFLFCFHPSCVPLPSFSHFWLCSGVSCSLSSFACLFKSHSVWFLLSGIKCLYV